MTYHGEDILRLIPQRNPFIMVDALEVSGDARAATTLTVRHDNYFMLLTGQNLMLHGVEGVTMTALMTCSELTGKDYFKTILDRKR